MGTEIGDLFLEKRLIRNSRSESAGGGNGLFHRQFRNVNHVLSTQFLPGQQTGFMEHVLRKGGRFPGELKCRRDTCFLQFGFGATSYSPYIADLKG